MDTLWIFTFSLSLISYFALKLLLSTPKTKKPQLPPGPSSIPIISTVSWLSKTFHDLEPILRNLHARYGPILTLRITAKPSIFIADRNIAHEALVHNGAVLADRIPINETNRILSSNRHNVSSAPYGRLWRQLRRNLTSNILHPSRIKHFAGARSWVLQILLDDLKKKAEANDGVVVVMESFHFAMFCLLVLMCFGEKLKVEKIREIEAAQKSLHRSLAKFNIFNFLPTVTKVVLWKRWKTLVEIRRKQEEVFGPLIRAREGVQGEVSYVDSLLQLSIADEGGRRLTEGEIVSLCSEFLSAGTDTTATALEWTMAELVKNKRLQERLAEEIEGALGSVEEMEEEDLQKMHYLKAVILEGLRRHPPAHFVVPHAVTNEIEIGGYVIPKEASINFMVAEMGWDEKVWKEPMEFRPERFLRGGEGEGVDITGSREIKMMPFGVGRRICPGLGLAMLHLEYFVASLVREFEWKAVEGEEIDLTERLELTVVMKNHLRAKIVQRGGRAKIE